MPNSTSNASVARPSESVSRTSADVISKQLSSIKRTHCASGEEEEKEAEQLEHPPEGEVLPPAEGLNSHIDASAEKEQNNA